MLALLSVGASAQTTLRKTWDFREGFSQKTINALKADQEEFGDSKYWRNYESDATKADEQHFWNASADFKNSDKQACTHSGGKETVISELEGLHFTSSTAAKKIVITYNGGQSANEGSPNGYHPYGKSYLWINGKTEKIEFAAEVNQTIKIGVESHANSQDRGISIDTSNGSLELLEGNPVPTFYNDCVWNLTGTPGETATITLTSTNGCHIYYIIVGDGDDPNANKTKVSYLTAGDATAEPVYQALAANEDYAVTAVDAATVTADALKENTVTVVSPELPADHAAVATLKEALTFTPILNLNAQLYDVWGYGTAAASVDASAILNTLNNPLFTSFSADEEDYFEEEDVKFILLGGDDNTFNGVKLGDFFAADEILASDQEDPTLAGIHVHNIYHNAYVFFPSTAVEACPKLLSNAIDLLKDSKSSIDKVSAPKVTLEYKDQKTNIIMAMAASNMPKAHIYYTLDGTEPTLESTEYTDTLTVTEAGTVKAVAIAEGYLLSDVTTAEVEIFSQPATPTITPAYNEGATEVTLASATEGVELWYNYTESNDTAKSMKYTEPLTIKAPATLTAFAVVNGQVFSELATQRIVVKNAVVRIDPTGAQFDANAADWQNGGGSTVYYFSWGKTATSIYDTTQEGTTEYDDEGNEITVYPEKDYEYYVPATHEDGTEAGWEVKSKGQVMIWQSLTVGSDPGNDAGYNPETAGDILSYAKITSNDIQFGGKVSGETCTGAIQSTAKYAGPFDIVTFIGTAAGGDNMGRMLAQVSTDSINWTTVGEEMTTSKVKRLWKSYTNSYEGTDEVYVRVIQAGGGASVQIYNIYVLNEGEQSQALKAQYDEEYENAMTGIRDVKSTAKVATGIYSLNGVRQQSLKRGLNIIVLGDGSVKKVVVK